VQIYFMKSGNLKWMNAHSRPHQCPSFDSCV